MSHYSVIKTNLKNPNPQLLKRSLEEIVRILNGTIVDRITDARGRSRSGFLIAFTIPEMKRGIGVLINARGEVEIVGDFWQREHIIPKLQHMITQFYTKNAMALVLSKRGYKVTTQYNEKKEVFNIVAVKY